MAHDARGGHSHSYSCIQPYWYDRRHQLVVAAAPPIATAMAAMPSPEEFEMLLSQTLVPDSEVIKQAEEALKQCSAREELSGRGSG